MAQLAVKGASGGMSLLTQHDTDPDRVCRLLRLEASEDGKSVMLVDLDQRKVGIQREYRFEITTGELISLIRAHGAELPGENHVRAADAS
jgi:hypothetical protein